MRRGRDRGRFNTWKRKRQCEHEAEMAVMV